MPCLFLDSPRLLTAFFSPSPPARSSGAAIVTPIGLGCSSRSILSPRLVGIHVLPPAQPILAPIYFDLPLSCWQLYIYPYTRPPSLNLPCSFCHCHSVSNQPVRRCFSTLDLFPKPPDKLSTVHYTSRRVSLPYVSVRLLVWPIAPGEAALEGKEGGRSGTRC